MTRLLTLPAVVALVAVPASAAEPVRFNRDVRPILADTCYGCHGAGKQKAGLRLDRPDAVTKPNKTGVAAVVPGKPDASELVRRVLSADADEVMPPPDAHKTLTAAQKETLRRWVAEGAAFEPHWSFAKLTKPPAPAGGHPVDAFLDERLAKAGLPANPESDRPALARRLSFALTGLPPSPADVDAFVNDPSPGAYERLVDHYLASPQYGEEMARHWLDLARYADTHGLHLDNERGLWPYRDWVVKAFNDNKRFDTFTVEQLAGDLLPDPTKDQLVATGFNRCNVTTGEGGSIEAEWYFRNAVDRAAVAAETWLGLTAGCAVCHDHKFDPLTQKDFYSLYAFFYSAAGPALDGNVLLHEPAVKLSTPQQEEELATLDRTIRTLSEKIAEELAAHKYADAADAAPIAGAVAYSVPPTASLKAWVAAGTPGVKLPADVAPLAKPGAKLNRTQSAKLREYYLTHICAATKDTLGHLVRARDEQVAERTKLDQSIPGSMIFRDAPTPRQAFVMLRGQYDKPGDKVEPNTPAFLPPLRKDEGGRMKDEPKAGLFGTSSLVLHPSAFRRPTRLDFAKWVVSPENPLTARVYVNRLWQQFFGTGLSKTPGDVGLQGEPPTHPELLDWLAATFRDGGWDVKATVRLLVTSAAFRRSAKNTPELLKADPENRLYARGPRSRLDAEQIRDNALAVGGLLNPTMGGKGVKPYQPDNIWEPVAYTGSNTRFYKRDTGSALYRRSIYTFYKRTAPAPFMTNFDAPSREQPCGRRDRSDTPLQALELMNDVQHVEAARALAERVLADGGDTTAARAAFAFKVVLARAPTPAEVGVVTAELAAHLARFTKEPADAKRLIAVGESKPKASLKPEELAAWTLVANTLLNLDETLNN